MKIREIGKEELNNYLVRQKHSQFLQSFEWGELQAEEGRRVFRLGFYDNEKMFFSVSLYLYNLSLGMKYLYAPRIGIKFLSDDQLQFVFEEIEKLAKKEGAIFLRLEPRSQLSITNYELRIKKTIAWQPEKTLILDLTRSEDEILKSFHQKTRYNIRLSQRKGVKVRFVEAGDEKAFRDWWKVMEETRGRDGFRLHPRGHYERMLGVASENRQVTSKKSDLFFRLLVAEYEGKIIAGNVLGFFGDMATYVHGASSSKHRNVMAPYLLQWVAIQEAKKNGFSSYDMHGIEERYPGVARFKKGFAGEEVEYPGTLDLVYSGLWYNVYKVSRWLRRKM